MQGIYKISCTQEDISYIGSSIDINKRWIEHRCMLNRNTHHNEELQLAWNAYGDDSFTFELLEKTENLILAEQKWIDNFWPNCYNTTKNAWNPQRNPATTKKGKQTTFSRYNTYSTGGKLNQKQALEIIALLNTGMGCIEIAKKYNLHYSSVYYIKDGKNWKHLAHLINLPKKDKEIAFELFEKGFKPKKVNEKLENKYHLGTIYKWKREYKKAIKT